jgi:hypothetical protein
MINVDVPSAATPTAARGARLASVLRVARPVRRAAPSQLGPWTLTPGPDPPTRLTASPGGAVRHPVYPSADAVMRSDR